METIHLKFDQHGLATEYGYWFTYDHYSLKWTVFECPNHPHDPDGQYPKSLSSFDTEEEALTYARGLRVKYLESELGKLRKHV